MGYLQTHWKDGGTNGIPGGLGNSTSGDKNGKSPWMLGPWINYLCVGQLGVAAEVVVAAVTAGILG
jgi:hypothetical protein